MSSKLSQPVRKALSALESRLLGIILLHGFGRAVAAACGLLLALYALDRLLEPPKLVRLILAGAALVVLLVYCAQHLFGPMRRRPRSRDLAAIWERSHPELADRLMTAVELREAPEGTSPALLERVVEQAALRARELDPKEAVPNGRAKRSALGGLATVAVLAGLAWLAPAEAETFLNRLLGGDQSWPRDTTLVLLPPHAEGAAVPPELVDLGSERFEVAVARGTVLTLRVRAEGVVPERITAYEDDIRRSMRPLGGGEFVLRLPPLLEEREFHFRGGDDDDDRPLLRIEPGIAPAVRDWLVRVEPPAYTGRTSEDSPANEFRVPQGTRLAASFGVDRNVSRAMAIALDGTEEELQRDAQGRWTLNVVAADPGERLILLEGQDGFRDPRAAVLRWWAIPDRPPRLDFAFPTERWTSVAGGVTPFVLVAEDDYGLVDLRVSLTPGAEPEPLDTTQLPRSVVYPYLVPSEIQDPETGASRYRMQARARDQAEPAAHEETASSPWVEVVTPETFGERLSERMARVREVVERLQDRTREILATDAEAAQDDSRSSVRGLVRRIRRDSLGLQVDLERTLVERIFSGLDKGSGGAQASLAELLQDGAPGPGAVVAHLTRPGSIPPLDQSKLLLDLSQAVSSARSVALPALTAAANDDQDPKPAARELLAQLDAMMRILVAWEDFNSAINLLRGLLDRQERLYLRTRKASER